MIRHIPNALTCLNLVCGLTAISVASYWEFRTAAYWIIAGAMFDFLDGTAARLLNVRSPLGKELDSLADVITFGAAPSLILFFFVQDKAYAFEQIFGSYSKTWDLYLVYSGCFAVAVFSAIRLAKFNLDDRQTDSFLGLATPANALFLMTLPLWDKELIPESYYLNSPFFVGLCLMSCFLLVSEIPLFSLKLKKFSLTTHIYPLILIGAAAALIPLLKFTAGPILFVLYFILSAIAYFMGKRKV